eukprot:gene2907-1889_t
MSHHIGTTKKQLPTCTLKNNNITKNTEYTKTTINRKITNNILNSISAPQSSSTLRNTILRQQLQITCTLKNMLILNKFVSHKNGATAQQRCTKPRPHKTSNTNYNHATTIITKPTQITYVNTKSITLKVLKYRPYTNTSNNKSKICTQSHHKAQTLNRATNIYVNYKTPAKYKVQSNKQNANPRSNHTKITIQHTQKTMFRKQINKYIPGNLHTQLAQLQSKPSAKVLSVKQLHPKATPTRATSNHKPILQTRQSIARPQRNSTTTPTQTNSYISDAIQSLQTNTPPNRKKTQSYPSFTIEAPKTGQHPRNHHRSVKPAKHNSLCEGANMQPTIQNINQSSTANLPRTTKINKLHFYHSNQERKPESTNKEIMNITIKVQIKGNLNANINSTTKQPNLQLSKSSKLYTHETNSYGTIHKVNTKLKIIRPQITYTPLIQYHNSHSKLNQTTPCFTSTYHNKSTTYPNILNWKPINLHKLKQISSIRTTLNSTL